MKNKSNIVTYITIFMIACASSIPRVKDVIELAPPRNVIMTALNGHVKISWDASEHENNSEFVGYNIYYAQISLILVLLKELPEPLFLDKSQHEFTATDLDSNAKYFVHVRSINRKGDISLPSLPEMVIEPGFGH